MTIHGRRFAPCPKGVESFFFRPRKGVMRMYITWTDFLQFTLVVLGIITVCITVNDNKKK